ncbi:MAG: hypothetical protein ABSC42_06360 [Tepidisphaeraceae bacterium]|jgi:hypothetical protein
MRKKLLAVVIVLLTVGFAPLSAMADDQPKYDGRLDDYGGNGGRNVTLDGGTALSYFVWIGLGLVGLLVMFKDAKRSHLD